MLLAHSRPCAIQSNHLRDNRCCRAADLPVSTWWRRQYSHKFQGYWQAIWQLLSESRCRFTNCHCHAAFLFETYWYIWVLLVFPYFVVWVFMRWAGCRLGQGECAWSIWNELGENTARRIFLSEKLLTKKNIKHFLANLALITYFEGKAWRFLLRTSLLELQISIACFAFVSSFHGADYVIKQNGIRHSFPRIRISLSWCAPVQLCSGATRHALLYNFYVSDS